MALLSRVADTFYAFRFLRLLTTPWEKTGAYKVGLIDKEGQGLREPANSKEASKYTLFHRLVFNIKRLLNRLPTGKTRLASYVAALWLIHENTGIPECVLKKVLSEHYGIEVVDSVVNESKWLTENNQLRAGKYVLANVIAIPSTGDMVCLAGTAVTVSENASPVGKLFGHNIYRVHHCKTARDIFVTTADLLIK